MSAPITAGWDDRGPYLVVNGEHHRLTAPQAREIRETLQVSAPSPGPRPPTPATVATPAPAVHSTSTGTPTRSPSASGAQHFLPAARDWCYRLGVSQDQVGAILDDPVEEWITRAKTADVAVSSDGESANPEHRGAAAAPALATRQRSASCCSGSRGRGAWLSAPGTTSTSIARARCAPCRARRQTADRS